MLFSIMNENVQTLASLYLRFLQKLDPRAAFYSVSIVWGFLSCREMYSFAVGSGGNDELVPYSE